MIKRYFLIFSLLFSFSGFSQLSVGIDTAIFSYTDTVNFASFQNLSANILLKNTSSSGGFADSSLIVYAAADSGTGGASYKIFYTDTVSVNFINPGDTAGVTVSDTVTSFAFRSGVNTVVIWPKASNPGINTSDSLFLTVFVDTAGAGFYEHLLAKGFLMFPNPAKEELYFVPLTVKHPYRRIDVYDLEGRLVLSNSFQYKTDIGHLRAGVYIIYVLDEQGGARKVKFIKE